MTKVENRLLVDLRGQECLNDDRGTGDSVFEDAGHSGVASSAVGLSLVGVRAAAVSL